MRRLPVFLLLDVSESMVGAPLAQMEQGVADLIGSLRTDPHALDTVWVSVLAFAGKAEVLVPLTELAAFYPPRLPLGAGTRLGEGLDCLMMELDRHAAPRAPGMKADWKPIVFLLTDGRPTDAAGVMVERFVKDYSKRAEVVAVALGQDADMRLLAKLTPNAWVFDADASDPQAFARFVRWISLSVQVHQQSQRVAGIGETDRPLGLPDWNRLAGVGVGVSGTETGRGSRLSLAKDTDLAGIATPGHGKRVNEVSSATAPPPAVILAGRCATTRRPYLMRYDRAADSQFAWGMKDFQTSGGGGAYTVAGCYPVAESYFAWSEPEDNDGAGPSGRVSTADLHGAPGCPHCGAGSAFAQCGRCRHLMCVARMGEFTCPWCGNKGVFSREGGGGEFDVTAGRG